jgi:hypothetical protein
VGGSFETGCRIIAQVLAGFQIGCPGELARTPANDQSLSWDRRAGQ